MCILLKLDYANFGVCDLFFKSYRRKPFGVRLDPPPPVGTGRVKIKTGFAQLRLKEKSSQLFSSCANIIIYTIGEYLMKFARAPRLSYQ